MNDLLAQTLGARGSDIINLDNAILSEINIFRLFLFFSNFKRLPIPLIKFSITIK